MRMPVYIALSIGILANAHATVVACNEAVRLRGNWSSEPAELTFRGITLGRPWIAPPCKGLDDAQRPCLDDGSTGEDTQGTFVMDAENLPTFGPADVQRTAIRFDNYGRVVEIRSYYGYEDYNDLRSVLLARYGIPTYMPDPREVGPKRVEPFFDGRRNEWAIQVHNRAALGDRNASGVTVWGGKDYAIILSRFNWVATGPRAKPIILPTAGPGAHAASELIVLRLLTLEELMDSQKANSVDRRVKKLEAWTRAPAASRQ